MHFDAPAAIEKSEDRPFEAKNEERANPSSEQESVIRPSRRSFFYRSASATAVLASGLVLVQGLGTQAFGKEKAESKKKKKKGGQSGSEEGSANSSGSGSGAGSGNTGGSSSGSSTGSASASGGSGGGGSGTVAAERSGRTPSQVAGSRLPSLFRGGTMRNFEEILSDENDHVAFLLHALGSMARPMPTFQNLLAANVHQFVQMSLTFENLGVQAYLGAAPYIMNPDYLTAAGTIVTVEARHAGFLNALSNVPLVPNGAFDVPLPGSTVVTDASTFIASLNGGTMPGYSQTRSAMNDIAILNFALALEFLEQAFYQMNVPKFFG